MKLSFMVKFRMLLFIFHNGRAPFTLVCRALGL